jgi:hypothetical protein
MNEVMVMAMRTVHVQQLQDPELNNDSSMVMHTDRHA